ncbi:hypothetical protein PIGBHMHK_00638 [Mycoplasmopsis arginini]|nr:hypothetical protein [Mycoplasmopsis arginini]
MNALSQIEPLSWLIASAIVLIAVCLGVFLHAIIHAPYMEFDEDKMRRWDDE